MKSYIIAFLASLSLASPAFSRCPVGGSEHSVGLPGPGDARLALERFENSAFISGARDLLLRHGFCPVSFGPQVKLVDQQCDGDFCEATYDIDMQYWNPATDDARTISGHLRTSGSARGIFSADALNAYPFGTEASLDETQSELVMNAMATAGIAPDQIIMGSQNLVAGRLQCSRPVVPNPITTCTWTVASQTIPVADAATAESLADALADVGAFQLPHLIGAQNTNAALVACSRGVYPGAIAGCSLVIEN